MLILLIQILHLKFYCQCLNSKQGRFLQQFFLLLAQQLNFLLVYINVKWNILKIERLKALKLESGKNLFNLRRIEMGRISKSYRFKRDTIDKLEDIQISIENDLGTKISATAAIEILINKYHNENIKITPK